MIVLDISALERIAQSASDLVYRRSGLRLGWTNVRQETPVSPRRATREAWESAVGDCPPVWDAAREANEIRIECDSRRWRLATDPGFRLLCNLRKRMYQALKTCSKSAHTRQLLGCTIPEWKGYLEAKFQPGMTWENYGPVWHVDHIKPCARFNFLDPAHQRACFHYTNTQPLFAEDNLRKGDRYEHTT